MTAGESEERILDSFFAGMFSPEWLASLSGILLLDLLLSGDNAILIALACKICRHITGGKPLWSVGSAPF